MSDDAENDDQWLYGEPDHETPTEESSAKSPVSEKSPEEAPEEAPAEAPPAEEDVLPGDVEAEEGENESEAKGDEEEGEMRQNGDDEDIDDDSDDDVNVVIGDIKTTSSYTSLNIKRGGNLLSSGPADKTKQAQPQTGKFSIEEFDQTGAINGVPATEFNLDSLEDKPWRKPGADITDYFNYGFNEDTWRAYCERQKRMRLSESGVGLAPQLTSVARGTVPIMNDNSKYTGNFLGLRKAGPPPGRRMTGPIDVIGGATQRPSPIPQNKGEPPKMNVIQVMTADRREYSRKPTGFPDMSVPPPNNFEFVEPEYTFNPEPDLFYGGYEPTQDVQWGTETGTEPPPNWVPGPGHGMPMGPPVGVPLSSRRSESPSTKERDERRERSRGRSERPRDRERERSHRRERSRSRSRRHKSRSRSPSHRSHRKKKSRRHEESD